MPRVEADLLRRSPVATIAVAGALVAAAILGAGLTWGGHLVTPVAWLLAAVVAATVLGAIQGGLAAAFVATASLLVVFAEPRWSLRIDDAGDTRAVAAFATVALLVALAIDAIDVARRRADTHLEEQRRAVELLDAVLEHAPVGIAFLDRDLRFVRVNEALLRMNGLPADAHLGRRVGEVLGDDDVEAVARRALVTGHSVLDVRLGGTHRRTGQPLHVVASYYPVREGSGAIVGVGAVVHDATSEVIAETDRDLLFERLARLQSATAALALARTTEEVVDAVLVEVRRAAGGVGASLAVLDGDDVRVLGGDGDDEETLFPLGSDVPLAAAIRTGQLVTAGSRADIVDRWPQLAASIPEPERAIAALPLVVDGRPMGAIGLSLDHDHELDPGERSFLEAIATQCSEALRRASLTDSERAARDRLAFLADASAALAETLELDPSLQRLASLAVPRLADWCSVFLVEPDGVRPVVHAHVDDEKVPAVRRLLERWPVSPEQRRGVGAVLRTGEAEHYPSLAALVGRVDDEERLSALLDVGFTSGIVAPLRAKGRTVGALVLATIAERRLGADDLELARELASRAAQAVLNAELFADRTHVADVLQRSLLPPVTSSLPGIDVATRFVPVGEGVDVGGDFYDVFRLGTVQSAPESWAIVVGDVRGKGAEAAAITAAARHAVRTAGLRSVSPAAMLHELNDVLLVLGEESLDETLEPMFCTAVVAAVTPEGEGARVTLAVAGHPRPMLLRADGATSPVGADGNLLGVVAEPLLEDVALVIAPGEALVLYTDGVTERHSGDRFFDEDGLAAAVSRCAGFTAAAVAERIELAARAFVEDEPRDDIAIVVIRVPTRTATSSSTSTDLPVGTEAPRLARRFVVEVLTALGRRDVSDAGALLASELVTNAVLHGAPPVRVSVEPGEARIRVTVTDGGEGRPTVVDAATHDLHGRGMLLVERLAARWGVDDLPGGDGKSVWFDLVSGEAGGL